MSNYASLKSAIQQVIKTNGNNEITGALLQQILISIVNSLGANYQFVGVATPTTNPGAPDQNVIYIAGPGTYPNFNSAVVPDGNTGIFRYNGSWSIQTFGADSIIVRVRAAGASNSVAGIGINRLIGIGWNGTTFALEEGAANYCTVFAVNGSRAYLSNHAGAIIYFRAYDDAGAYLGPLTQQFIDISGTRYFFADLPNGTAFIIANRFPDRTVRYHSEESFNNIQKFALLQKMSDAIAANDYIDLSQYSIDNSVISNGNVLSDYTAKQAIFFHANSKKTFFVNKSLNGYPVFAYDKDFNYLSSFNVSAANNTQIATAIYQITYTLDNVCYLGFSYEKDNGVKRSIELYNYFYIQNLLAITAANADIVNLRSSITLLQDEIQNVKKAAQVGDLTMALIMPMMYDFHGIVSPTAVAQMPVVSATANAITLSAANAATINKDMALIVQLGSGDAATFKPCFFSAASGNVITKKSFESIDLSTATVVMSVWDTPQGQNGMHLSCLGYKAYAHSVVGLLNRYSMIETNQVKGVDMTTCALAHAWNNPSVYDNDGNLILTPTISGLAFGGYAWEDIARSCVIGRNNNNFNATNGWRSQAFYIVQNNAGYIEFPLENINAYGFLAIEAGCCDNRFQPTRDTAVIGGATVTVYNNGALIHTETLVAGNMRRIIIDNIQAGTIKVRFTLTAVPTCLSIYSLRFYNLFAETPVPSLEGKKIAVLGDSWTQFPLTTDATVTPGDPFNTVVTRPDGTQGGGYGYFPKELARITRATIDNWGKSGETSEWALTQIDTILAHNVYDYIILEFGLNDRNSAISIAQWKANLTMMANKAKLRGVRPIILSPTVTNSESQSNDMGEWFENLMNGLI